MIYRILILMLSLLISAKAFTQQDAMYSQYVFNGLIINPAYAGTRDVLSATMIYRNQWVNMPGAPKTGILSVDAPLKSQKVGVGVNLEFDKIGVTNHTSAMAAYAYRLKFAQSTLSFGIQAGVSYSYSNFTAVNYTEDAEVDDAFTQDYHDVLPEFGFGLYYYTQKFYVGLSIPQFAGRTIQNAISKNSEGAHLDLANHYFVNAGYLLDITPDVKLRSSVLLKYVNGAPMEMDINEIAWFYDILALGVSYRSLASINIISQIRITDQLHIGYAYEYATNGIKNYSRGSHEIMLQYQFDFSHDKIITPRYF
jgi:type IX secretion system PorP/SprF family membrane protein